MYTNLKNLANDQPFSQSLNDFVNKEFDHLTKERGIQVVFVEGQPYDNYEELKFDIDFAKQLYISTDFSDTSIFGDPLTNWKFRAVHDMQHYDLDLDFEPQSEFMITYKMLGDYKRKGLSQFDIDLLQIEMNGQVAYYVETGDYPVNQREFTIGELNRMGYTL